MQTLNDKTDSELIKDVKENNSSESFSILSKRHEGLVAKIIRRYYQPNAQCSGLGLMDLMEDKEFLVFDSVKSYNLDKGVRFNTWLGNKVRYHCLNKKRLENKYYSPETEEIKDYIFREEGDEESINSLLVSEEAEYIMGLADQIKDPRVKKILQQRYFADDPKERTFGSIAKNINMSKQGVINIHHDFINFVKNKIKSAEVCDEI